MGLGFLPSVRSRAWAILMSGRSDSERKVKLMLTLQQIYT